MTKKEATIVLFSITLCWASSYIFIKDIPQEFSTYAYLALTSGTACLILGAVFHRLFRLMNRRTLAYGTILALLITGNMLFEKLGLDRIPASAASAFASSNIIIVPLFLILAKKYPSRNHIAGILIIIIGIAVNSTFSIKGSSLTGVLYMLGSCVMMSLYTIVAAEYTKKENPMLLTVLQLGITSVIGFVLWFATEPDPLGGIVWSRDVISYILILAFFSKAYAYSMLMYAEKYADAITVTVVAATEPVVTLLMAVLLPNTAGTKELFSVRSLAGALIIAVGAVVAGTDFLSKKKTVPAESTPAGNTPAEEEPALKTAVKVAESQKPMGQAESPEPGAKTGAVIPGRKWLRYLIVFTAIVVTFAVLGVSIELMDFSDGYTNVRPENFIPALAGLLFGPVGAAACAAGNFIADRFFDFGQTSWLGVVGNFLAAYIPYRIWYSLSVKKPHTHSLKGFLLFSLSVVSGNLVCAWVLSSGLGLFFGHWYDLLMEEVFWNNLIFSFAYGLPFLIVLTSENTQADWYTPRVLRFAPARTGGPALPLKTDYRAKLSLGLVLADIAVLLVIMFANTCGSQLENSGVITALSVLAAVLTAGICFLPYRQQEGR